MAIKASTGLRNHLLATGSLAAALAGGKLRIFAASSAPATADDAETGTLLVEISSINMAAAATAGVIAKASAETWSATVASTGTALYYRHVGSTDDGTSSTTQPRVQGTVGVAGADMNLSSVELTASATQTIDYYSIALPTL